MARAGGVRARVVLGPPAPRQPLPRRAGGRPGLAGDRRPRGRRRSTTPPPCSTRSPTAPTRTRRATAGASRGTSGPRPDWSWSTRGRRGSWTPSTARCSTPTSSGGSTTGSGAASTTCWSGPRCPSSSGPGCTTSRRSARPSPSGGWGRDGPPGPASCCASTSTWSTGRRSRRTSSGSPRWRSRWCAGSADRCRARSPSCPATSTTATCRRPAPPGTRAGRRSAARSSRRSARRSATRCPVRCGSAMAALSYGLAGPLGGLVAGVREGAEPAAGLAAAQGPVVRQQPGDARDHRRRAAAVVGGGRGRGRTARPATLREGRRGGDHAVSLDLRRARHAGRSGPAGRRRLADRHHRGAAAGRAEPSPASTCAAAVPGTRETDLLDPRNLVERVHAIVLTGGSALGLGAADGVAQALLRDGIGFPVDLPPQAGRVVPIVPAAVIFDLGRGGEFGRPSRRRPRRGGVRRGRHAGGRGQRRGGHRGQGRRPEGRRGQRVDHPRRRHRRRRPGGRQRRRLRPGPGHRRALVGPALPCPATCPRCAGPTRPSSRRTSPSGRAPPRAGQATTLAVVATDATLTKAQCAKLSGAGHDGMARALNPVHTMFDGDTVFTLATGGRARAGPASPSTRSSRPRAPA